MMTKNYVILLILFSLFITPVYAQLSYGEAQLNNTISQLEELEPTPSVKLQLKYYQQALKDLTEDTNARQTAVSYQKIIDDFPVTSQTLKARIADHIPATFTDPSDWSLNKVEQEIAKQNSNLTDLKQQQQTRSSELTTIGIRISSFQTDIEHLRRKLTNTQKESDKLISTGSSNLNSEQEALRISLQIKESSLSTQIQMLELEQLSASNRSELAQLNRRLIRLKQKDVSKYLSTLTDIRNSILRKETEDAIARSKQINDSSQISSPFLQLQLEINQELSKELATVSAKNEIIQRKQQAVTQQVDALTTTLTNFNEQVEWLKISSAFGENLRAQVSSLPSEPPLKKLENEIVESRLARFRYKKMLTQLDSLPLTTKALTPVEHESLLRFIELRRLLLSQLISSSDNHIYEQTKLKVSYSKMNSTLVQIKQQADEHLFWVPSSPFINTQTISELLASMLWIASIDNSITIPQAILSVPLATLSLALLFILGLIYLHAPLNKYFTKHIAEIYPKVGKVTRDKFSYTLRNLAYSFADALLLPLSLFIITELLISAWEFPFAVNIGHALQDSLFLLVIYLFMRNLTRHKGLLQIHLKIDKALIVKIWGYYQVLFFISWPSYIIQVLCYQYPEQAYDGSLGRLAFIITCCALTQFYYRLYREKLPLTYKKKNNGKPHIVHHSIWTVFIMAPIASAIIALMGYLYTAQVLLKQMESSLLMGVFFLLTYYLIRRGMHLQKRRLAFERAKAKRIDIIAQRAKEVEKGEQNTSQESHFDIEEPEIDLDQISAQSLGLLRTLLTLLFIALNALFWSEIQSAFTFLDTITLWDAANTLNGVEYIDPITLKSCLLAITIFVLTLVLVRNLSGALELLILQHLDLSPGTGFAITTLAKYMTISIGFVVGFNFLGVDWAKTQWLVAALTVGLGFGLQEIFANFVSGLIILFEKPIRIGDTVTIRELTGSISKIQTRATTIVDWDRKEIIVPNKAFITEQFINWSLSDSITRVIIHIRVEFNSDIELVTKLLLDCAEENSLSLENPGPEVFFIEFGQHSLCFEVRCYVAEMGHRLTMTHALNTRINQVFKEHNIRIALQQLDLNVKHGIKVSDSGHVMSMKKGSLR
ncbi:miniconductance mechanosensitive channel MscM [Moritella sp. 5]|uniref:miniconductance mechanosensitive channel MscM n=1 Tax=Moritella sp. 5 TaxID=2746231 RepID=UPI001BAC02EB|nr:miniconductance mechanosensitive channel MscM [Moritella sp. 5]QUM82432.1 miniconductance mechanosensitive channel MscM [Moritella sp. 5]